MTLTELIVTTAGGNVAAVLVTRLWSHFENKDTTRQLTEIHVLVNNRLTEALERVETLKDHVVKLRDRLTEVGEDTHEPLKGETS